MPLPIPEYDDLDAIGLAELVRGGALSAGEVLEAAIARCEARNPALNAVVLPLYERARRGVGKLPEGPLRGVPTLLKDLKIGLAGTPTSNSCALTKDKVYDRSSVLTERYEAAGMQIFGKTNTPQFGIMGVTESALRGPCRNPWNTDHSPGGSSGGAASAVAARIVPVAHGGDGGGSIRIPASACGIFGLKPTRGRVTQAPFAGDSWMGFVQEHMLTVSVRDSALLLDIADQPTPGEPYAATTKARPFLEEVGAPTGRLRIAFCREALYADHQHPDCVAAVDDAAKLLTELGHEVVEAKPQLATEDLIRAYLLTVAAGTACFIEDSAAYAGVEARPRDFEPGTWVLGLIGQKTSAGALERARRQMQAAGRVMGDFMQQHDIFLTSTWGRPPVRVGELGVTRAEALQAAALDLMPLKALLDFALHKMAKGRLAAVPNTQLYNQTGAPAVSVPLHWSAAGLPIGVQLGGRMGDEATLIRLSAQLEQARPWAGRKPVLLG